MPNLYEQNKDDYSTLLAADVLDASKGALFSANGLTPDDTNRTILIGLGGTGVRTIDYVKGAISKRLDASWKNYVAFLGIDASWTEFDGSTYLDPSECMMITKNGINQRMSNESTYPAAVRKFMPEGIAGGVGSLHSDGSGRTRLIGKIKVHDQTPGGLGIDEEIVSKLVNLKSSALAPLSPAGPGTYQVYIIGSVCGGTCSGAFLEMPALIRKAIPNQVKVNAMLYLPDTLTGLDPQWASRLMANGYASLKELNYYMGMYMRPGYAESWTYNSPADPELTCSSSVGSEGFIDVPYLIGTTNGASADAHKKAMETIAEFLISLLAKISTPNGGVFLTSAFVSNANTAIGNKIYAPGQGNTREATNEFHEAPKRFSAIGFAEASAPKKLVRAYTVGRVCEKAGLRPVSRDERKTLEAAGKGVVIPFRGEDDMLHPNEGTAKAEKLLSPIKQILGIVHSGAFNMGNDLNETEITWTKIKRGHYDNAAIATKTNAVIQGRTGTDMMEQLRQRIKKAFDEYRVNVQEYVRMEGPYAFSNLYNGRFLLDGNEHGRGIHRMIQNLVDGRLIDGKPFADWQPVENMASNLNAIRSQIANTNPGLLGMEGGNHRTQCSQWVDAYNKWAAARINEKRREIALGVNGAIYDSFLLPAAKLASEIEAFGRVLDMLTGIYRYHGSKLESFEEFQTAQDNCSEVNIAAVSTASYNWLKNQADEMLTNVDALQVRDNLVDHFFDIGKDGVPNSRKWLEIPQSYIKTGHSGKVELVVPDVAIPAREIFDQHLAVEFPATLDVSIETMFEQMKVAGQDYDATAHAVMKQLSDRSLPLFNGDIPEDTYFRYIMYPNSLKVSSGDGPKIAQAIEKAANVIFPGVQVYASDDADSIMFYQQATPMEIYRLAELGDWEKHYEQGTYGLGNTTAFLHGKAPDVTVVHELGKATKYVENMAWKDYPPIARYTSDPTKPDAQTGQISREGKFRLELQALVEKAKKLGVLYSENTPAGWVVKRVNCSRTAGQWNFDVMACVPDAMTGLLPLGKDLAEAVAVQNNQTIDNMSRNVMLDQAGVMSHPHVTEALAWEYAVRVLRSHIPMYREVCETVVKFEAWAEEIIRYNAEIMKRFLPAKMIYMLKARILRQNANGAWELIQSNGTAKVIANMAPAMLRFLPPKDKKLIENGLLGYYLFGKLSAALNNSSDAFEEAYVRAKATLVDLANDGEIDALVAGDENAAVILAEQAALAEKGARLDGEENATPREKFVKAMTGIVDLETLKDIDMFYFRVGLWELI